MSRTTAAFLFCGLAACVSATNPLSFNDATVIGGSPQTATTVVLGAKNVAKFSTTTAGLVAGSTGIFMLNGNSVVKFTAAGVMSHVNGLAGTTGTDASAASLTAAKFSTPKSITMTSTGDIYVADTINNRIVKIVKTTFVSSAATGPLASAPAAADVPAAGTAGTTAAITAQCSSPYGIVAGSSQIIFSDSGNKNLKAVAITGGLVSTYSKTDFLETPYANAVGNDGTTVYTACNNAIVYKTTGATVAASTFAGQEGFTGSVGGLLGTNLLPKFTSSYTFAMDGNENIYIYSTSTTMTTLSTRTGMVTTGVKLYETKAAGMGNAFGFYDGNLYHSGSSNFGYLYKITEITDTISLIPTTTANTTANVTTVASTVASSSTPLFVGVAAAAFALAQLF